MGSEHLWWGGMWFFPIIMPILMLSICLLVIFRIFGRGTPRLPWNHPEGFSPRNTDMEDSALDILKKRYAKGEMSKEEFEMMRKDIE